MAALHSALSTLSPTDFSSVPQDTDELAAYLKSAFKSAQTIVDSVPLPPPSEAVTSRPRSETSVSEASNSSEISSSAARSDLLDAANGPLQKEWGKPLKLNPKDNPLGISAYKLAGKDGRGAWFARRSVHEGMGFKRWKLGLEREFPETLEMQGAPGEGNIRGIGGERRVERKSVKGVGAEEVYYLTAQFPGPSTSPRDFVTLLLTSSNALGVKTVQDATLPKRHEARSSNDKPRHFMVISRPCTHPDCPPRSGFVRGQYESVEFIREIPRKPKKSASAFDLSRPDHPPSDLEKNASKRNGMTEAGGPREGSDGGHPPSVVKYAKEARQRGKTISVAGSRGLDTKGEMVNSAEDDDDGDELNPVEWVMVTRSDPGGSVPRFMVERGTPGGIIADAAKFLDWATKKEHFDKAVEALENGDPETATGDKPRSLEAVQANGHLAGLGAADVSKAGELPVQRDQDGEPSLVQERRSEGVMTSVANVAMSGIEAYAPQALVDRLAGYQQDLSTRADAAGLKDVATGDGEAGAAVLETSSRSSSPTASFVSFSSSGDHADDAASTISPSSQNRSAQGEKPSAHEKELARLNERKRLLNEKLAKTRDKEMKDREELTTREEQRIRKAEEKHKREMAREESKYTKQVAKLEAKKRKTEEKNEKVRLTREKDDLKQQLESVKKERDVLKGQVGALQRENTILVVRLGKMGEGKEFLQEVKAEGLEGNRSRSSSLIKRSRPGTPEKVKEATILGKESALKENINPV